MGFRGAPKTGSPVDYGDREEARSISTEDRPALHVTGDFGARTQGGISGMPPAALVIDYDAVGGLSAISSPPNRRDYASVTPHGIGGVDGQASPDRVVGTVFPEDRSGMGDAPSNRLIRFIRRYPVFMSSFQPVDHDPDLVGRERFPLPRLTRFASRYTMRHEDGQNAQRFSGLHTRVRVTARDRASMMAPPRSQRLTQRNVPTTFGAKTQVLSSAGVS